jgi:hypothetical protein
VISRQHAVAAIVILVGLYDVCIGLFMLFSTSPHLAHGTTTLWAHAPELAGQAAGVLASLFARLGAFSLHAGLISIAWCLTAWRNRRAMTVLLLTYLVSGFAFFASDLRYFAGTPYFMVKQILGTLWVLAIVLHFWPGRAD